MAALTTPPPLATPTRHARRPPNASGRALGRLVHRLVHRLTPRGTRGALAATWRAVHLPAVLTKQAGSPAALQPRREISMHATHMQRVHFRQARFRHRRSDRWGRRSGRNCRAVLLPRVSPAPLPLSLPTPALPPAPSFHPAERTEMRIDFKIICGDTTGSRCTSRVDSCTSLECNTF